MPTTLKMCTSTMPIIGKVQRRGCCNLFKESIIPGLTVGFMIIPQAIAYALLAGLPPIYGLYSSTMSLFVYSLFGSSGQLSVGPVAMVSLLTKGVIDGTLPSNATDVQIISVAIVLAFCVGIVQCLMGLFSLGSITKLLSHDVLMGFTSAAAIIIGFSQMKYIFGITIGRHHYPWQTIADVFSHLQYTNVTEFAVSFSCLTILIVMKVWRKRNPKWQDDNTVPPIWWKALQLITSMSALVVVVLFIPISAILYSNGLSLKVVGEQPSGMPSPSIPSFSTVFAVSSSSLATNETAIMAALSNCSSGNTTDAITTAGGGENTVLSFFISAVVIALIGFMESLAVAVSVDESTDGEDGVKANQELVALGLANVIGSFFSSFPVAGSFGRTAVNAKSGAQSTMASFLTGCFVVFALFLLMPAFAYLPYAVLASIIEVAVVGLIDINGFQTAWRLSKSEFVVSTSTFFAVLAVGIEYGILIGTAVSIGFVLKRASMPRIVPLGRVRSSAPKFSGSWRDKTKFQDIMLLPSDNSIVLRVDSAIFFANTSYIMTESLRYARNHQNEHATTQLTAGQKTGKERKSKLAKPNRFVLHLSSVDNIDLSGIHMIYDLDHALSTRGFTLYLTCPRLPVRDMLNRAAKEIHHQGSSNKITILERTFDSIEEVVDIEIESITV
jgi:SulP family sulfate permease